ncbi:hypothetical protein CEXT_553221 [Caerostris extrusa]|uniref:Uncharacterized protein n=1 Tax=Caerostris extrusa TaxID=172846 RepID=A0AAV4V938_CAEEX|nr:hypothetical protein CEXT_553221 [Caerostris extrusa]
MWQISEKRTKINSIQSSNSTVTTAVEKAEILANTLQEQFQENPSTNNHIESEVENTISSFFAINNSPTFTAPHTKASTIVTIISKSVKLRGLIV